jgi:hypothetical protein
MGTSHPPRAHFARAAAAAPDDIDAALHYARAIVASQPRDDAAAIAVLEPLARHEGPRAHELRTELACALYRRGDPRADALAAIAIADQRAGVAELAAEFATAVRNGLRDRPAGEDLYLNESRLQFEWSTTALSLAFFGPHEEHVNFYHATVGAALRALFRDHPGIDVAIEFGALCGYTEWRLAEEFPQVSFVGVDRSARVKAANDENFPRPNLRFEAADIRDVLAGGHGGREAVLVHSRTAYVLYPDALAEVYARAARAGIRHIVGVEETGISRTTGAFLRYGADVHSLPFRPPLVYGHDYPYYLDAAGYAVIGSDVRPLATLWKLRHLADSHAHVFHAVLRP